MVGRGVAASFPSLEPRLWEGEGGASGGGQTRGGEKLGVSVQAAGWGGELVGPDLRCNLSREGAVTLWSRGREGRRRVPLARCRTTRHPRWDRWGGKRDGHRESR